VVPGRLGSLGRIYSISSIENLDAVDAPRYQQILQDDTWLLLWKGSIIFSPLAAMPSLSVPYNQNHSHSIEVDTADDLDELGGFGLTD
jgi:hypothetical protein